MESLSLIRRRHGLSQRALAKKARISFKGLQLLESPGHDARLSSLQKIAEGLGLPRHGPVRAAAWNLSMDPGSLEAASSWILQDGPRSWSLHLFNFADSFRTRASGALVEAPPLPGLEPRLQALTASLVEALCDEAKLPRPWWTLGVPALETPWFPSETENLKASALVESPVPFRKRNIFVLANFLQRA
jgi:transcriptional regulator with XRE-family HTH domain